MPSPFTVFFFNAVIYKNIIFFTEGGAIDIDKTEKNPDDHSFPKLGLISSAGRLRKDMPDEKEVERQLNLVLQKMDLPQETSKILRDWKKWEMICDHVSLTSNITSKASNFEIIP